MKQVRTNSKEEGAALRPWPRARCVVTFFPAPLGSREGGRVTGALIVP